MKVRLVKPEQQSCGGKMGKPVSENQMAQAVQSWVKEFKSCKESSGKESIRQLRAQRK